MDDSTLAVLDFATNGTVEARAPAHSLTRLQFDSVGIGVKGSRTVDW